MNPGMLMVEREMNLPNLTHFLVSNRAYGGTSNAVLPNFADNDYAAMARAMGLSRVFEFGGVDEIERGFPRLCGRQCTGPHFRGARSEPFSEQEQNLEQPPFDGPELKFRFGALWSAALDCNIFGYRL